MDGFFMGYVVWVYVVGSVFVRVSFGPWRLKLSGLVIVDNAT